MIGDSPIVIDSDGDITINERVFKGSTGLWELLMCKNVNTEFITKDDPKKYKKILMTNGHLNRHQPDGNINTMRGKNFAMLLRPPLRNLKDAVLNPHYVVSGQNINGYR